MGHRGRGQRRQRGRGSGGCRQGREPPRSRAGWSAPAGGLGPARGRRSPEPGPPRGQEAPPGVGRLASLGAARAQLRGFRGGGPEEEASEPGPGAGSCAPTPARGSRAVRARPAGGPRGPGPASGPRRPARPGDSPSRSCLRPETPAAPSPRRTWPRPSPAGPWVLGGWEAPCFRAARLFSRERAGAPTRRARPAHARRPPWAAGVSHAWPRRAAASSWTPCCGRPTVVGCKTRRPQLIPIFKASPSQALDHAALPT